MKVNIYGIVNPNDKQVVYIGQTSDNLIHYLKSKYWKLNEVKRGERAWTKLFHFLNDLLPIKADIVLLYECDTTKPFNNPDGMECLYIKKYREINPNLLNETDGGIGGRTTKFKTINEKKAIGFKISSKIKGKKKPAGFAENLSINRKGAKNPTAKPFKYPVACYDGKNLVEIFDYAFQINEYFGVINAWSNIKKVLEGKLHYKPYGYTWKYIVNS